MADIIHIYLQHKLFWEKKRLASYAFYKAGRTVKSKENNVDSLVCVYNKAKWKVTRVQAYKLAPQQLPLVNRFPIFKLH